MEAVGPRISHDVALATKDAVALETRKMAHMPRSTLGLGALVGQNELVAGGTARLERLGVVSAAVKAPVAVKVDQVNEQFAADAARKAARVPAVRWAGAGRHHSHIATSHRIRALKKIHRQTNGIQNS